MSMEISKLKLSQFNRDTGTKNLPYLLSTRITHTTFQVHTCKLVILPLEPIGSAKPKLSQESDILRFRKDVEQPLALTCPAQGSPLPAFRLVVCNDVSFCRAYWYSQAQALPKVGLSTILRGSQRTNISALPSTGISDPIIQVRHKDSPSITLQSQLGLPSLNSL